MLSIQTLRCMALAGGLLAGLAATGDLAAQQGPNAARNTSPMTPSAASAVEHPIITHLRVTGSLPAMPGRTAEDVLRDFTDLYTAGNYRGAALLAEELIAIAPNAPQGYYNLCCAKARLRDLEAALDAFAQAIARGWRAVEHTAVDPDLDPLRGLDRFDDLIERMTHLRKREQVEPAPLRSEPWSVVIDELNEQVPALMQRYNVPGVAIAIVDGSEVVWRGGFGTQLAGQDLPMACGDQFRLQRPVGLLTLIGAAQLQQQELLDVQRVLAQADEIGLRQSATSAAHQRPQRRGQRLGNAARVAQNRRPVASPRAAQGQQSTWDWHGRNVADGTLELMMLAVELTAEQSFHQYCRQAIFEAADMRSSHILSRATQRQAAAARSRRADADVVHQSTVQVVAGHSRLGTPQPIQQPGDVDAPSLITSANDLAGLLAAMQRGDAGLGELPLGAIAARARLTPNGLGLGVDVRRTADGLRVQLAERSGGVGCLLRWYPDAGRGVVIMFNSESGPAAAERIAQRAIGGR